MLLLGSAVKLMHGVSATVLWSEERPVQMEVVLGYGLLVMSLWYAPVFGWLLLVSSWAKRAALLWALLPLFAVSILDAIALHTSYSGQMLHYRMSGSITVAFVHGPQSVPGPIWAH